MQLNHQMTTHETLPLRYGNPGQFEIVRNFLQRVFPEREITQRLGIESVYDFKSTFEGRKQTNPADQLDAAISLLLDGDSLDKTVLETLWGTEVTSAFAQLDLLREHPVENTLYYATAVLYPVENLFIASDRPYTIRPAAGETVSPEYVYPAISSNTRRFLRALPVHPCESFLDMCAGSGAAALIAASNYAQEAFSLDITERSTHFAEFNRLLNGIENATVLRGDLYEPVQGLTFDRIVAHPPYVPAQEQQMIFRDGGSDGEQITAAIIRNLPSYLRPGGVFYAVAQATDRDGELFEQRIRRWLGEAADEFDLILMETEVPPPDPFEQLVSARRRFKQILENKHLFSQLKVTGIFYGTIILRRHVAAQPPITTRTTQDKASNWQLADWLLRWELDALDSAFLLALLEQRPKLSERLELHVTHLNRGGNLVPERYRLQLRSPFLVDRECHPWVAVMLAGFSGEVTGREAYGKLQADGVISEQMPPEEFARLLSFFVSQGVLEVSARPLPSRVPAQNQVDNPVSTR
jgi:methylase of polypeptide subunit release factors